MEFTGEETHQPIVRPKDDGKRQSETIFVVSPGMEFVCVSNVVHDRSGHVKFLVFVRGFRCMRFVCRMLCMLMIPIVGMIVLREEGRIRCKKERESPEKRCRQAHSKSVFCMPINFGKCSAKKTLSKPLFGGPNSAFKRGFQAAERTMRTACMAWKIKLLKYGRKNQSATGRVRSSTCSRKGKR